MIKLLTAVVLGCCAFLARAEPNIAKEYFPCQSCHGVEAEGSPAIHAPALVGQSPLYLARQLRNFQNGNRGAHARDKWGAQMALMATNLAPGVIEPLSEYISQLRAALPENLDNYAIDQLARAIEAL